MLRVDKYAAGARNSSEFGRGTLVPSQSIEQLLGYGQADRAVRAYAYLTVAFKVRKDVNDVLDCLLPFVVAVINRDGASQPIVLNTVADGLSEFGLKIPVYAVQQLLNRLNKRGLVEWNQIAKAFIPTRELAKQAEKAAPQALSESFDELEGALNAFARSIGVDTPPHSPSWSDALIHFLRSESAREAIKAVKVKNVLVGDPTTIEGFVVARFVQESQTKNTKVFESIIRVFTGILIEDFISNIQEVGSPDSYRRLTVYYDTSVILRLLGTSGKLLQTATLEMHTTIQSLGCNTQYFDATGTEVLNILSNLESAYSKGKEIYGETADAIHAAEITIEDVKDLMGTYDVRLGALNVFPFDYDYKSRKNEDAHQIDERAFSEALKSEGIRNERGYSEQNAFNDAHVVALVLRLRRGRVSRDIGGSRYLFVTKNSALQRVGRKFATEHVEEYDVSVIPPVLTVSQITTAAWIAATRNLEEHKVSRELLASCYAAVQPNEAWADEFARVFEKFRAENPEFVAERANSMIFLNTARATARDESLNQALVLKNLNIAELFRQAAEAEEAAAEQFQEQQRRQQQDFERAQREAVEEVERQAALRIQEEGKTAEERGRAAERERLSGEADARLTAVADSVAKIVVGVIQIILGIAFVVALAADLLDFWHAPSWQRWAVVVALGTLTVLSFLDVLGLKVVGAILGRVRQAVARMAFRLLRRVYGSSDA